MVRRPSKFWSKPANKLKKCSERRIGTCDQDATDDCCEVVACTYCLIWETYGENPEYGTATFTGNSWEGSVGPIAFRAFWERGYQSGECEFVAEANGEEVYRKSCYEGQSCRDSSDEATVSIPYAEGTLGWSKDLKRPLPHVTDYGTTCKRRWCGDCECTCECLCVTVVDGYTNDVYNGELCDNGYSCDGPVWAGTINGIYISVALEADEYTGECYLAISGDYEDFDVDVTDCMSLAFSVVMYDGTTISGECKLCKCEEPPCPCPCCPDCWRGIAGSVGGILNASAGEGGTDCGKPPGEGSETDQVIIFSCTETNDDVNNVYHVFVALNLDVRLVCDRANDNWKAQYRSNTTAYEWTDTGVTFTCPSCEGVESGGLTTGSFTFVAYEDCETSGGVVTFPWNITIEITAECT